MWDKVEFIAVSCHILTIPSATTDAACLNAHRVGLDSWSGRLSAMKVVNCSNSCLGILCCKPGVLLWPLSEKGREAHSPASICQLQIKFVASIHKEWPQTIVDVRSPGMQAYIKHAYNAYVKLIQSHTCARGYQKCTDIIALLSLFEVTSSWHKLAVVGLKCLQGSEWEPPSLCEKYLELAAENSATATP